MVAGRQAFQKPEARARVSVSLSQGQPCFKEALAIFLNFFFLQFDHHTCFWEMYSYYPRYY